VTVTSGVPQESVLGPLLFLAYVNDIWRNDESIVRLFADNCVIYINIINNGDIDSLQKVLDRLEEWAAENAMKINPSKCKAVRFFEGPDEKNTLNYTIGGELIPEASSCKYFGIIFRSDLSWADHVNYTVKKAWKALHFIALILKKENSDTKCLTYTTVVTPILEYGDACWDPHREGQIHGLNRVQK
jgi:hypothetical protein